ncbi:hypothetical protein EXIGLDRAFT_838377 [Exidia glandulosa HHB12029]|uniref:Uncharacterized protein n=1 Tax=Exidia glandulosa HHB12029 TaxID=1314781 RepID=A0A165FX90_EXIGL|nr:hypothetical protein EXIGLDRAFT_838377 [Exidia glandulosa HHB12029]
MPPHWQNTYPQHWPAFLRVMIQILFAVLCMVAFGSRSLERRWNWDPDSGTGSAKKSSDPTNVATKRTDPDYMERISVRVGILTIIASSLLSTAVTFLTSDPPSGSLIQYQTPSTQRYLWVTVGLLLSGIIAGSSVMYMLSTYTRDWGVRVAMSTRGRVWCGLILLSYPFFVIFIAIATSTIGFTKAALQSEDLSVRIGAVLINAVSLSLLVPLVWRSIPPEWLSERGKHATGEKPQADGDYNGNAG